MLAERSVGSYGALEDDTRLRHGRCDDVRVLALLCGTLVKEIAIGAPRLEGRLHRRRGDGLLEETQRRLVGLQLSRHGSSYRLSRECSNRANSVAGPG
jgi:hypothetical protein